MAQRLLAKLPKLTAVFAANHARAFHAAGVRIREDISLIGFDDVELTAIVHPPLTTISQPVYEIGKAVVETVIRQLAAKDPVSEHRTFDVRLVERESCRPRAELRT